MSAERRTGRAASRRSFITASAAAALSLATPNMARAAPQRIVSLDYGLASTLLALGITPLAVSDLADWDKWMGEPRMPASVINIGSSAEPNMEMLTLLKPDLILTTPYLDANFERLGHLAPLLRLDVFSPDAGSILPSAIAATRKLAVAIGREREGEAFLERADRLFADCRLRLAEVDRPPLALVNFMDERHVRIYGAPGLFDNVLSRIGLSNAWSEPTNFWGFTTIAIEDLARIRDADAMLVAFEPIAADIWPRISASPLWQDLPFARPGHFHRLPPILMFGMVNEAMRFARLITAMLEDQA